MTYSEMDVEELRRKSDRTMPGVSQGDRIRLRPVGTTWLPDEPDRPGNLDTIPNRASTQGACTCGAGEHRRPSLLPGRKVRAVRTSAPLVDMRLLP